MPVAPDQYTEGMMDQEMAGEDPEPQDPPFPPAEPEAQPQPVQPQGQGRTQFLDERGQPIPPPAPLSPEAQAALQHRLALATQGRRPVGMPVSMGGGGVGIPDMGAMYTAALSHLPVEEALKAVDAAMKFQGMRGYQQALASGKPAHEALATWAPMLFHSSPTAMASAMTRNQPAAAPQRLPGGEGFTYNGRFYPARTTARPPVAVQLVDEIGKTEEQARQADAAGDSGTAQKLRDRAALLREQTKGQETVVSWDEQGRPVVRMGKGAGGPTTATASQAQQKLVRYENSMELMNRLDTVLKPEHVGARGVAGEWLVDKGLQQVAELVGGPDVSSEGRMQARKLIIALREGLMRDMTNDNRFTLADREEISKALPSSGIFESFKDAKSAINLVRDVVTQRSRNYAKVLGQAPPLWTMSSQEITELYKNGKIDRDTALQALVRFH